MKALGHPFNKSQLLQEALTHSSVHEEDRGKTSNRRLAYLGDAVIELAVRRHLTPIGTEPKAVDARKQNVVDEKACANAARKAGLRLVTGKSRGSQDPSPAMLGEAFEAVVGAIFEDAGFEAAADAVLRSVDLAT